MDKRKQVKEKSETKKTHKRKTQNKRERYGGSDIEIDTSIDTRMQKRIWIK